MIRAVCVIALLAATACGGRTLDGYDVEELGATPASHSDDRLQPFEVGHSWQYQQTIFDPSQSAACNGPFTSRVVDRVTLDGKVGWAYYPSCIPGPVMMFLDGDAIDAILGSVTHVRYSSPPVVEGFAWEGDVGIYYVWHDAGSTTVGAGTFDRCWRRASLEHDDEYIILCRGTGLVVANVPSGNFRLELAGKNF